MDWTTIRDRTDLVAVVTTLLGAAPGRRGERSTRRLWWPCPFHQDSNSSFCVTPGNPGWICFGCGEHGDAAELVMKLRGVTFPEAIRWLAEQAGIVTPSGQWMPARPTRRTASPAKAAERPPEHVSGLPLPEAMALVESAEKRLWTPGGAKALTDLRIRFLIEATVRAAHLGWTSGVMVPKRDGVRYWGASGIVIPWFDGDRLALVKLRRHEGRQPRYLEVYRHFPRIYPGPEAIRFGAPLVIVEGEFDALLLGLELRDIAAVVTLGSSSSTRPEAAILGLMLPAPGWFLATDGDTAGENAASGWPARARRVRPPAPDKDWTEAAQSSVNLRRWWRDRLGGIESPLRSTSDELVERYGTGIVVDSPVRPTRAIQADGSDRQERAAIMEFDGGLSREAAERAVGLDRDQ